MIRLVAPLIWILSTATCLANPPADQENCRVAIDVGHTRENPGAVSARGVGEFHFNQAIARQLFDELRSRDAIRGFVINEQGRDIALTERTSAANRHEADLLISIHHDSVQPRYLSSWTYAGEEHHYSDRFRGYSLFYSSKNRRFGASLELARELGSALRAAGFVPTLHHTEEIEGENRELVDEQRGIYLYDDLVVLKTAAMPAVLLECGVILNREEEAALATPAYQQRLAATVAGAIEKACFDLGNR